MVAVTGIEGGDCFDFAHRLGQETGVGQKERDNGLVILLSTDERCVQFATGYGLEGDIAGCHLQTDSEPLYAALFQGQ